MKAKLNARAESGQVMVVTVGALIALIGMTALVLDVGAWFRSDRHLQAVADAAALAGAQALPDDPGKATALADEYATKNGPATTDSVDIDTDLFPNDTIAVKYSSTVDGFFSRLFGIDVVTVSASAAARASAPSAARWVAPIAVNELHPLLHCGAPGACNPDFGTGTTLDLAKLHKPGGSDAAGAFGLINLEAGNQGSVGASTLGDWVRRGYDEYMDLGTYHSVPSAMFNSSEFRDAMDEKVDTGDEILLPIYRPPVTKSGSNAEYNIVGWVGFVVTGVTGSGESAEVHGHFTKVIWDAIPSNSPTNISYGVRVVSLTK